MNINEQQRDFEGIWIPKNVYLDDRLNALDKIILVEINSLDTSEELGCYASNEYLAKFCQCTETKISTSIKKLIDLGYIKVIKFDGRKRYLKSSLKEIYSLPLKNLKAAFKKFKDNNIDNNKDYNIISSFIEKAEEEFLNITPMQYEMLLNLEDTYGEEKCIEALKECSKNNVKTINYLKGVLKNMNNSKKKDIKPNWLDKEIKSEAMDQAELEELEKEFKMFK